MKTQYIVSSPSRTGSTYLCNILRAAHSQFIRTHDCHYLIQDPANTVLIFSLRKNSFRSMMSCLLKKRTDVNLPKLDPFEIKCDSVDSEFDMQYNWHRWYVDSHYLSRPLQDIKTLYFEDFLNNHQYVYDQLKLTQKFNIILPIESQYRYEQLITNHKECKERFDWLEINSKFTPILEPYDPTRPN